MVTLAVKVDRFSSIQKTGHGIRSGESVVFCPWCKTFQTVWINDNKLIPTRKFFQEGNNIYHDCGSSQPCRLYHNW